MITEKLIFKIPYEIDPALTWSGVFGANYYDHWRAWDAGSLSLTGALVDQADSLTGSGRNMVSSGGARPTLTNDAIIGKNCFGFDSVSDFMEVLGSTGDYNFLHNGSGGTVIFVVHILSDTGFVQFLAGNNFSSTPNIGYGIGTASARNLFSYVGRGVGGTRAVNNNTLIPMFSGYSDFNVFIDSVDADNATAADRSVITSNFGAEFKNNSQTNLPSLLDASGNFSIGKVPSGSNYLHANVAEVLLFDKIFDATDYTNAQTILSQDYGTFPIS